MSLDWYGETVYPLDPKYERVMPGRGKTLTFTVRSWLLGTKTVHMKPDYAPREKIALGLTVDRIDKPDTHHDWAVVGGPIVALLEPQLRNSQTTGQAFSIALVGKKPYGHWIVTRA